MIGHVSTGANFYYCLKYCLEDKQELSEEQKQNLTRKDNLNHKNRAEVLHYNQCFGSAKDLAHQFMDVQKLSKRIEKPVLHLSLRLAPGELLTKVQLTEIGQEAAKEFGISDHQYICVLHKDTREQHIHIVANRVGYNGKATSDSNNYRKMAALCRKLEKQFNLREVLSPRMFLPAELRLLPRHDSRKLKLQNDLRQVLEKTGSYQTFEQKMKALGYRVIKGRGISFIDDKKVKIKGSEVGFSLAKIERILELSRKREVQKVIEDASETQRLKTDLNKSLTQILLRKAAQETYSGSSVLSQIEKELRHLLYYGTKVEPTNDYVNPALLHEARKKKRKRPRL